MPMEEKFDANSGRDVSEEDLFMSQVICGDAELLYLDVFLTEVFRTKHI